MQADCTVMEACAQRLIVGIYSKVQGSNAYLSLLVYNINFDDIKTVIFPETMNSS